MNFVESLFDMSQSIIQSLCDKELRSEPEPPVLLGERWDISYTVGALDNFQAEILFGRALYFSPASLKVLSLTSLWKVCATDRK